MSAPAKSEPVVLFDDRMIWHLAGGTKIREVGAHGREFTVDQRIPGKLWLGNVPCFAEAVEMPVEVFGR